MRLLLGQQLVGSVIYLAAGDDGRFHVLWCESGSIGSARTLQAAMALAGSGPLFDARDGSPIDFLRVSQDPGVWMLCGQGGCTDAESVRWPEKNEAPARRAATVTLIPISNAASRGKTHPLARPLEKLSVKQVHLRQANQSMRTGAAVAESVETPTYMKQATLPFWDPHVIRRRLI